MVRRNKRSRANYYIGACSHLDRVPRALPSGNATNLRSAIPLVELADPPYRIELSVVKGCKRIDDQNPVYAAIFLPMKRCEWKYIDMAMIQTPLAVGPLSAKHARYLRLVVAHAALVCTH